MNTLGYKIDNYFSWLNSEDKNKKDKYAKGICVVGMLIIPILLVAYIDNPADYASGYNG